jgi:hypothetical protein
MVHALRRAIALLAADGVLIDLHPTTDSPQLTVAHDDGDEEPIGTLASDSARERHAAADRAIDAAIAERTLSRDAADVFVFSRYSDSADELADHVNAKWTTHFSDDLRARARQMLRPGSRLRLWEYVSISALRPMRTAASR